MMRWRRFAAVCMAGACVLSACTARRSAAAAEPGTSQPTEPASQILTPGSTRGSIEFHGVTRTYALYVPASLQPGLPAELVVALHGGGGNAANLSGPSGSMPSPSVRASWSSTPTGVAGWKTSC